jgi:hypothetical protein
MTTSWAARQLGRLPADRIPAARPVGLGIDDDLPVAPLVYDVQRDDFLRRLVRSPGVVVLGLAARRRCNKGRERTGSTTYMGHDWWCDLGGPRSVVGGTTGSVAGIAGGTTDSVAGVCGGTTTNE